MSEARPLDELFAECLKQPPGEKREAWIKRACARDEELERWLRDLLAAHEAAGPFMSKPIVKTKDEPELDSDSPDPE